MARDTKLKDVKIVRSSSGENYELECQFLVNPYASEGAIPKTRDAVVLYADEPCVEACKRLYDLNIETITSNGHIEGEDNDTDYAYIGINYESLSDENKEIANSLITKGIIDPVQYNRGHSGVTITIKVLIRGDSLVGDISDKLLEFANLFQEQDVLYGRYTLEDLKKKYFKPKEGQYEDEITLEIISEEEIDERFKYYLETGVIKLDYTEDNEHFFKTEDLLRKHKEYIKKNGLKTF